MSVLNNEQIIKYRDEGEIIIEPFNPKNLKTSSYDVRLGEYYFREQKIDDSIEKTNINYGVYNMYSEKMVKKVWGEPQKALPYSFYKEQGLVLENVKDDDKIIMIEPGESILGHTEEFIGSFCTSVAMLHSRSSLARSMISSHMSAGWSDVSFFNRFTFEIQSNLTNFKVPLIVGRRIAQIVFLKTEPINSSTAYHIDGKYQTKSNLKELIDNWSPYDMLPKKYLDYEITEN